MFWFAGAVQWIQAVVLHGWFVNLRILKLYMQSSPVLAYRLSIQLTATHLKPNGGRSFPDLEHQLISQLSLLWNLHSNQYDPNTLDGDLPSVCCLTSDQSALISRSRDERRAGFTPPVGRQNAISIDTIEGNTAINHKNAGSLLEEQPRHCQWENSTALQESAIKRKLHLKIDMNPRAHIAFQHTTVFHFWIFSSFSRITRLSLPFIVIFRFSVTQIIKT